MRIGVPFRAVACRSGTQAYIEVYRRIRDEAGKGLRVELVLNATTQNMQKIKAVVTSKLFLIGLAIGIVVALAFGRFLRPVKKVADMIPGSDAKKAAPAA